MKQTNQRKSGAWNTVKKTSLHNYPKAISRFLEFKGEKLLVFRTAEQALYLVLV